LAALVCGLTAPVALLADLHQPGRFLNFYLHPNFGSWMAWGSFFIPLYLLGLIGYAWLCLRPLLAEMATRPTPLAALYRKLAYGGHDNPSAIKAAALLTALGAVLVLLYSGMEVMVVQARSLWNTALLPLIFAATAMTGGIGMTALFEALTGNRQSAPVLNQWLARGVWVTLALLILWLVLGLSGTSTAAAEALGAMRGSFGWLATGAWLIGSTLLTLWLVQNNQNSLIMPALLALHGAWLIRWIVFIGGQSLPKMGSTSPAYSLTLTPDSLLGIVGMAGLCLALYIILTSLIPWDDQAKA
jgi:tetrathionate reductase subunit C